VPLLVEARGGIGTHSGMYQIRATAGKRGVIAHKTRRCTHNVYVCKSRGAKTSSVCKQRLYKMSTIVVGRTTIDSIFLWVDVRVRDEVVRLMASWFDQRAAICALLGLETLQCTGYIATATSRANESVLLQLNTRACKHSDLAVYQVQPLQKRIFVATVMNTSRLSVTRVLARNAQKLSAMGWSI